MADDALVKKAESATPANVIFRTTSGPYKPAYDRANSEGRDHKEIFSDCGFVVRARAETGEDVVLWCFTYRQNAREVIVAADLCQTLLIYGHFSDEQKAEMNNTPFVNKGQNLEDYMDPGSLSIVESSDQTVWSIAGRDLTCNAPHWHIGGDHAGVKCDINLTQRGPGFFHTGTFEELGDEGTAGGSVHGTAEGTIEHKGKLLKIKGYFVHERILLTGTLHSRIANKAGAGSNWFHAWGPKLSWYILNSDIGSHAVGMVTIGDVQYVAEGQSDVKIEEKEHWLDPLSRQLIPYKWQISLRTKEGLLEASVQAYGRAYYPWLRRGGTIVVNQFIADGTATFTYADGRVIREDQLAFNEHMRTFYIQASSLE